MNHDETGVQSDCLTLLFIYGKRRPNFLLKLILVSFRGPLAKVIDFILHLIIDHLTTLSSEGSPLRSARIF